MSWGDALASAWQATSDVARQAATTTMSSARAAATTVQQAAATAAQATADAAMAVGNAAVATGRAVGNAAVATGRAVGQAAVATGRGVANVAGFGARAAGETVGAAAQGAAHLVDKGLEQHPVVGTAYKAAKQLLSPTKAPRATSVEPCPNSVEGKIKRLEERNQLIKQGSAPGASPDQKAAAARLARNNEAVELARLSEDTYKQYDPNAPKDHKPPLGWNKMSDADLAQAGIDKRLLEDSKAVVYQTPENWPGGQETVLAFRGTVPSEVEDLKTNMDQALGKETVQYKAANQLGLVISKKYGADTLVTGHSLGGGKAQAAGSMGGLTGMMFNSAGLHPDTVGGAIPLSGQFLQYRSPFDPLTGVQNSAALQSAVAGVAGIAAPLASGAAASNFIGERLGMPFLSTDNAALAGKAAMAFPRGMGNLVSEGYVIPPAQGRVIQVPSLDDAGQPIGKADLGGQHSVHNVINGIEREKSEDIATLKQ
ncbi:Protein of unknown function (DUF2974) [Burkholderiales bacterium JOSHI_001]|nr:Protein of unknown function (DUF2974) [Burkholderiales bacterium JOSHI_001]